MATVRKVNRDARIKREGSNRAEREPSRAASASRELSDSERVDMFRKRFFQSSLPDLPQIPGHHTCWLTTTNPRDPIHGRIRLGYELLRASDIPGWEYVALKQGEYAGCIGVNEMLAAKLPLPLFEAYMREVHHDQPLEEERRIYEADLAKAEDARRQRASLILEGGTEGLGQAPEPPSFAEEYGEA